MELKTETGGPQVLAIGQDPDHVRAHDGRRQFVFNRTVRVLVRLQQLFRSGFVCASEFESESAQGGRRSKVIDGFPVRVLEDRSEQI